MKNDPSHVYMIIGPDSIHGDMQFFDAESWSWTIDFNKATQFETNLIFFTPLPTETVGVIEINNNINDVPRFFPLSDLPPREMFMFV